MTSTIAAAIGRVEERQDVLQPVTMKGFAALLDLSVEEIGTGLPPLWHWGLFQDWVRPSALGQDGHPRRGGFLPWVDGLDSRMFAGGRLRFHHPLQVGEPVTRRSVISAAKETAGGAGRLLIVTVEHNIFDSQGLAITEEQDLVFRSATPLPARAPDVATAAPAAAWQRQVTPDSVMLFRMSALTGNGHRIHYDRPFAMTVEGYPGLVVHGPLQAIWMADLLRRHMPAGQRVERFSFRGRRPAFVDRTMTVEGWMEGDVATLRTRDDSGTVCMTAEATFL